VSASATITRFVQKLPEPEAGIVFRNLEEAVPERCVMGRREVTGAGLVSLHDVGGDRVVPPIP
jgi:hypothetical protein